MCGIAGGLQLDSPALARMVASLHHRGPDDSAVWNKNGFAMGMTRLAILDLASGQQPFRSQCGRVTAICNGEIYNWRELRQQLEEHGHTFHTQCDCEILPAAWLQWGTSFPEKLNGMFALAIHDEQTDSLFLARDRCGQKPLYYTTQGPFRFASEVKALAASGFSLVPDPSQLSTWLSLRYLPEPFTLFRNLVTLPAAHWMTIDANGNRQTQRYWQPLPTATEPSVSKEASLDELDRLTRSSVELALQSDVPIGCYLSAGVDSSLLAYYLKDLGADPTTISIGFGAQSDETSAASAFAKELGLAHHPSTLTPDCLHNLPQVISQMERPVGDGLILAFDHLASHTHELGLKVALGGEGPDEHFAGYSFQKAFLTAQKLGPLGRRAAAETIEHLPINLLNRLANFPASLGPEGRSKTAQYLREFSSLPFFHQATRLHTLFEPDEIAALLHPDLLSQQVEHPVTHTPRGDDPFSSLLALQYQHWLPDWSLIRQDKNAMAHSLEYRAPFLDHRLIDFAFNLSKSEKINRSTDKAIWRQLAARHLTPTITQRPKQPFYLPLEHPTWREPLIKLARDVLTPSALAKHGWLNPAAIEPLFSATTFLPLKQLAALVILQIWLNQFDN